jgi:cold shock protein
VRDSGVVKWFDGDKKGYGFIAPDGGGKDVFVHRIDLKQSCRDANGIANLSPGQRVTYLLIDAKNGKGDGKKASDVEPER